MNELRSIIPSIPKALEMLHNDPSNDELGKFCLITSIP